MRILEILPGDVFRGKNILLYIYIGYALYLSPLTSHFREESQVIARTQSGRYKICSEKGSNLVVIKTEIFKSFLISDCSSSSIFQAVCLVARISQQDYEHG